MQMIMTLIIMNNEHVFCREIDDESNNHFLTERELNCCIVDIDLNEMR